MLKVIANYLVPSVWPYRLKKKSNYGFEVGLSSNIPQCLKYFNSEKIDGSCIKIL